ncbi:MAG TPA: archaellin/type IV pilin N-terminal domain-containing protein [Candidatus Bathyarchaeia archaeon]|jgi:FlaG/FlaF family flagellin (archaellin)|nr:archaellin/type IV pilin N-terminal domain-containing protein [Candidatus Bathyarchaeia archaeon]
MNTKRFPKNKKGIDTILAALLMVVIVVVAAVMVYAWSTGLLGTLLVNPNTGQGPLTADSSSFSAVSGNYNNLTIYIRNAGTSSITLNAYYISDSTGNTWQYLSWGGPTIAPNTATPTNLYIGASCTSGTCTQSSGTSGSFNTFNSGYSYTVKVITTKNNPFTFTVTRT